MSDWLEQLEREAGRYHDGESRLGDSEEDPRQRQLTRLGNAAWGAGLSALMLGRCDDEALPVAGSLQGADGFPPAVAGAFVGLAAGDREGAAAAIEDVLVSFETRDSFLEDVPVADTVLCLHALAAARWPVAPLRESALLPRASS